MGKTLIALCALAAAFTPASSHAADNVVLNGFQGAQWGATVADTEATFQNRLVRYEAPDDKSHQLFGLPSYVVNGCDFHVDFRFVQNRLSEVQLSLTDKRQIGCGARSVELLTAKYGAPDSNESDNGDLSEDHYRKWLLGRTIILETESFFSETGRLLMSIDYRPLSASGEGKL